MKSCFFSLFLVFVFLSNSTAQVLNPSWVSYYSGQLTSISDVIYEPVCDCIYIAGYTADNTGIATVGAHKEVFTYASLPSFTLDLNLWKSDVFLAKFDRNGNRIWGTYIGGNEEEKLVRIKADNDGNIFVTGTTRSTEGITTTGAYAETKPVSNLATYLMKFDADGTRLWGTYYDIYNVDTNKYYSSICVDIENNVYIGGIVSSYSEDLATAGVHQTAYGGGANDGYIAKFSTSGERLWATYYGGAGFDYVMDLAYSNDGYLYSTGQTNSITDIATEGTYQPTMLNEDQGCSYLTKWNPDNGERIWGTYISTEDVSFVNSNSIAIDDDMNIYVVGETFYPTLPLSIEDIATTGTHQIAPIGSTDIFLMKFDKYANKLWGTYYGGIDLEDLDNNMTWGSPTTFFKNVYVSNDNQKLYINGLTYSNTGIANDCGYSTTSGNNRGFIASFNTADGKNRWGSYYDAEINNIAVKDIDSQKTDELYFVSRTHIDGLATEGSHLSSKLGLNTSGLLGKMIMECPIAEVSVTYDYVLLNSTTGFDHYTWYHNGTEVADGVEATLNPGADTTGYYHVVAEKCGCMYRSDTFYFDPLGIEMNALEKVWQVYPNPVNDMLILDMGVEVFIKTDLIVHIVDIYGRTVVTQIIPKGNHQRIGIPTALLVSGTYVLKVDGTAILFSKY